VVARARLYGAISRRYPEVPFKVTISSSVASALRELDIALTSILPDSWRERDAAKGL
jgi:hypothetical protein